MEEEKKLEEEEEKLKQEEKKKEFCFSISTHPKLFMYVKFLSASIYNIFYVSFLY